MTSEDAESKDMEVNVLDELLENADDDDLAAELNNEEKKVGKKVPPAPSTPASAKTAAAKTAKRTAAARPVKKPAETAVTAKKTAPSASKAPTAKPQAALKKKPATSAALGSAAPVQVTTATTSGSATSAAPAQAKASTQPKLVKKIPAKIASKAPTIAEKATVMKAKPVVSATGEPKMSAEDLLTTEQAAQKGVVIKKTVARKIPTTAQTPNKPVKKPVAAPKAVAPKATDVSAGVKVKTEKVAVTGEQATVRGARQYHPRFPCHA